MKFLGNFEFKNKNNKPKKFHITKKNKKTGIVVLEVRKEFYPDYCESALKKRKSNIIVIGVSH